MAWAEALRSAVSLQTGRQALHDLGVSDYKVALGFRV